MKQALIILSVFCLFSLRGFAQLYNCINYNCSNAKYICNYALFAFDAKHNILWACDTSSLYYLELGTWKVLAGINKAYITTRQDIKVDNNGTVWLLGDIGLVRIKDKSPFYIPVKKISYCCPTTFTDNTIQFSLLLCSSPGKVKVFESIGQNAPSGISSLDYWYSYNLAEIQDTQVTSSKYLGTYTGTSLQLSSIAIDKDDKVWASFYEHGHIYPIIPQVFTDAGMRSFGQIFRDWGYEAGTLINTPDSGFCFYSIYDNKIKWLHDTTLTGQYLDINSYANKYSGITSITNLAFDKLGRLWIASQAGVFIYDGTTLSLFNPYKGALSPVTFFIDVSDKNVLWMGGYTRTLAGNFINDLNELLFITPNINTSSANDTAISMFNTTSGLAEPTVLNIPPNTTLSIYNMLGQLVSTQVAYINYTNNHFTFDNNTLTPGIYIVKWFINGHINTRKIVVRP